MKTVPRPEPYDMQRRATLHENQAVKLRFFEFEGPGPATAKSYPWYVMRSSPSVEVQRYGGRLSVGAQHKIGFGYARQEMQNRKNDIKRLAVEKWDGPALSLHLGRGFKTHFS